MRDAILLDVWRYLLPVPGFVWRKEAAQNGQNIAAHLGFMSPDHHNVRNYVVRELPRYGKALAPETIAAGLDLPLERVKTILDDLEKHMTFLYRSDGEAVDWAYPVTAAKTPHRVTFDSGEKLYAA